jgi:hypothetical protein
MTTSTITMRPCLTRRVAEAAKEVRVARVRPPVAELRALRMQASYQTRA